ncbi:DHA2 family multidrug resistance protein [Paraburkholderia sp. GV068]|jgi:DHA2 family multidrug resistance protein|uniref:DHA2 family efflux MFS transporter permease subunit n=1 Tax=Paraburkholderia TaxID=1822464 RepID=UPI000D314EF1|nr:MULTISPECIES: DHA2 family efflux MFS transporter permease subunit [Paraburkholderia]AXF07748.1 EmrB/QacA family drug resistance transporter [Paraburkholderia graminis]MDR6466488.1 DHA2 family multidrug resistance protein [Paraburkholderia graminis]MDR6474236.1 DHA2 family multidrug resistance protein [Paraburkholderia graminis]PTQ98543.1 DHA2 family multidrug resistance protein [Paraburkholderia sp. GV072]PUB03786.1 DHA2 family multidrug resistance protein [Paraburkholderia sp. GV068]
MNSSTQLAPPPLSGAKLVLATFAVALATFMNVLDSSIANVAIPTISGNLGVSVDEGTWVITLFSAANAVAIPLTGWLTQRVGQIKLFVAAIVLFVFSSWLCGVAPNLVILLAARVLQGAVAGPLIPLSQAILLGSYPKEKSSTALALWAMTATVGPIAGPALGGWITDSYSWSWIFYINIPVGLFAAAVTWFIYRDRETPARKLPIDKVGLMSLVAWVASLQIMLDKGKDLDWFSSPVICILAAVAAVSFVFFLIWEFTEKNPIVDLRLFAVRNFRGGTIAISVAYAVFFANLVILPQWIQGYLGYRSVDAGLVTAPLGIFAVLLAPVMAKIMPKTDARVLATLAFVGFAAVFLMRSHYTTGVDTYTLVLPTLLQGIPMALFFTPLTAIILSGLSPDKIPAAAGLSNFVRVFAGGVGTSLITTGWNNRTILHHAQLAEQSSVNNPAYTSALADIHTTLGGNMDQAAAFFERSLNAQAAMLGLNDIFWLSSMIFIVIIPLIWLTKPGKGGGGGAAAGAH